MIRHLISLLFRRRPVVVNTFRTQKDGDWIKRKFELHRQLANELGRPWPKEPQ